MMYFFSQDCTPRDEITPSEQINYVILTFIQFVVKGGSCFSQR